MKNYSSIISLFTLLLLTIACSETHTFILETPKKVSPNSSITLKLREANNLPIDSIHFFVNGQRIASTDNFAKFNTKNLGIGKHSVTALSFYPGKTNKKNGSFEIFPTEKPNIYTYKIINTYPHDTKAYTQGLEFHKGFLYETTGHRGQSTLRKVELAFPIALLTNIKLTIKIRSTMLKSLNHTPTDFRVMQSTPQLFMHLLILV